MNFTFHLHDANVVCGLCSINKYHESTHILLTYRNLYFSTRWFFFGWTVDLIQYENTGKSSSIRSNQCSMFNVLMQNQTPIRCQVTKIRFLDLTVVFFLFWWLWKCVIVYSVLCEKNRVGEIKTEQALLASNSVSRVINIKSVMKRNLLNWHTWKSAKWKLNYHLIFFFLWGCTDV